jgi:hypothetical protein
MKGRKHTGDNEDSELRANTDVGPQEVTRSRKWTQMLKYRLTETYIKVVSGFELGRELSNRHESREMSKI